MAPHWQRIKVELLSGLGQSCQPPSGRILLLPPGTTFDDFGEAIDSAFARWDLAHLRLFTLPDGRTVTDDETSEEMAEDADESEPEGLLLEARVEDSVDTGDVFTYVFDFGDAWTHRCEVEGIADPHAELGFAPDQPTVCWGWGTIPDQYGRSVATD